MSAQLQPQSPAFDVLGIVTSAGGLEAMSAVLADLPAQFHAAVLVGQHLGADSALAEILQRRVHLPVRWVADGARLEQGVIHLGPPQMQVEVLPDLSCHVTRVQGEVLRVKPLDAMLQSLADSCGARAIGVVLTGMGNDGAAGARALKEAGGAVIVQDEASAAFPDMPRAAAEAGAADLVLPLHEIGRTIIAVVGGGAFPVPRNEGEARQALFGGAGPAREALRRVEWAAGPLGPVLQWPAGMRAVVASLLDMRMPACSWWGPDLVQVYNDAWIALLGDRHPEAAGRPARVTWSDPRSPLSEAVRGVLDTGQARQEADQQLDPEHRGERREAYFTLSHSPLAGERGRVAGCMTIATDTTSSVVAQRRLLALRELTASAAGLERAGVACERAARVLEQNARDVPFVLLYLTDSAGLRASLCASAGVREGSPVAPRTVDLFQLDAAWPLGRMLRQGAPLHLPDLQSAIGGLHAGPWPEPPRAALLVPLRGRDGPMVGMLVAGLSPRLALDEPYREFLQAVANQVATNIGEARLRERDRERLVQLSELDRTKTEFFSNISHEFRTPLTLILGPLEDLLASRDEALRPMARELGLASRNARRLLHLVDTLLDFSQLEAGRLRARFEPTDLSALTRDIASLFRSAAERAGLRLEVDCPPAPFPVRVDRGMWETVVSNLLSNALKFTFRGTITVRLRYLPQHAQLEVADTGVGIPQEDLPHLFRRFHRVRSTRGRSDEGAGIGLAIVDELARLHYGRVRVRSELGQGATFTVWVNLNVPSAGSGLAGEPREGRGVARLLAGEAHRWVEDGRERVAPEAVRESMIGPAGPTPLHGPGARVLVADDNADMRDYLARTLAAHWTVVLAANGEEALELARAQAPDLVLADVMMPMLDGFGLVRELRADAHLRATPVVLLTAQAHEEAAIEGLLAGAADYLAKPFSTRELVARVGAQLELARVRRRGERQVLELLALMPVGVYSCDPEGRLSYWNRHAVELWGAEPPAGDTAWGLLCGPRALAGAATLLPQAAPMARVLRSGEGVDDAELAIVRGDGSVLDVLLNIRPLHDEQGAVSGGVCAFVDVTVRKRAERALQTLNEELEQRVGERTAALRESEQRLALAFATLPVGIAIIDPDGNTVMLNETMRRFLPSGVVPSRDPARTSRWRAWAADGTPVQPRDFPTSLALRGEQLCSGMQMLYCDDEGHEVWTEVRSAALRDPAGAITGALSLVIDVDRLKRSEEAARSSQDRQEFVLSLSDAIRHLDDPMAIMATVSERVGRHLGAGRCGYAQVPPPGDHFVVDRDWTDGAMPSLQGRWPLATFGEAVVAQYRAGKTVVDEDTLHDERTRGHEAAAMQAGGVRSGIAAQLMKGGEWAATFYVQDTSPRAWTRGEVDLVEDIAQRTWAALERARSEAALRDSEERRRLALAAGAMGSFVWQVEDDRAEPDARALDLFGFAPGTAFGLGDALRRIHPADVAAYRQAVDHALSPAGGGQLRTEARFQAAGGGWRWLAVIGQCVFAGEPARAVRMFGTVVDTTAAKEAERTLRDSEERYRLMFETMDEGYLLADVLFDDAGRAVDIEYVQANPAAIRMVGTDLAGRRLREVAEYEEYWYEIWGRVARTGQAEHLERYAAPDCVWYDFHVFKIEPGNPQSRRVGVLFKDVTARKQAEAAIRASEARYRTLFETMGQGYCELELLRDAAGRAVDQRYLEFNPVFERIFGIPVQQAQGRKASEVFPGLEPWWHDAFDRIARAGVPERIEHEVASLGRWYEVWVYPRGGDRLSVLYEDISARRVAEEELRRRNEDLERFHAAMAGREQRLAALEEEVDQLLVAAGQPPRYARAGSRR